MNKKSTTKKSTVKKTNRKKMPAKKPTRHSSQAKTVKMVQIPELSIVKDGYGTGNIYQMLYQTLATPKPAVKQRNFWDLFSNVKNHNWQLMMQKGNYLDEFVKTVEEMPEEQFRVLFIEPKEDKPVHITEKIDCGCGEPCLCMKTRTVRIINKYSEYLKAGRLERYDIEIQHLRYLINLQNNGKAVPPSYDSTNFFKRSDAPKKNEVQTTSVAKVLEKVREANNSMHEWKAQTNDPITTNSLSNKLDEWDQKYTNKEPVVKRSNESDIRPSLTDLSEAAKTKKMNEELWDKFVKDHELYMSDSVDDIIKVVPGKDNVAKITVNPENKIPLPAFWQALEAARTSLDAVEGFYAKKQVELILATRAMRAHKNHLLNVSDDPVSSHLENEIKKYLKAKRNFAVVKKIMKLAYKEFDKADLVQIDSEFLQTEMVKYTKMVKAVGTPTVKDYEKLFDHMSPIPKVYNRVVSERVKNMRAKGWVNPDNHFSGFQPAYASKDSDLKGRFRDLKDIPTVMVENIDNKSEVEQKQKEQDAYLERIKNDRLLEVNILPVDARIEKMADEIQNMVAKGWIDPEKDFPNLIKNGLDSEGMDKWKEKYQNKSASNADLINDLKSQLSNFFKSTGLKE